MGRLDPGTSKATQPCTQDDWDRMVAMNMGVGEGEDGIYKFVDRKLNYAHTEHAPYNNAFYKCPHCLKFPAGTEYVVRYSFSPAFFELGHKVCIDCSAAQNDRAKIARKKAAEDAGLEVGERRRRRTRAEIEAAAAPTEPATPTEPALCGSSAARDPATEPTHTPTPPLANPDITAIYMRLDALEKSNRDKDKQIADLVKLVEMITEKTDDRLEQLENAIPEKRVNRQPTPSCDDDGDDGDDDYQGAGDGRGGKMEDTSKDVKFAEKSTKKWEKELDAFNKKRWAKEKKEKAKLAAKRDMSEFE
jgi:hypothetical protein